MHQDPSFGKCKGEGLYVADTSNIITRAPTMMGKVQDTTFVQNNQGARKPKNGDTDQDNASDPLREQHRFYWSSRDRDDFQPTPECEEWATIIQQWEKKTASAIGPVKNGTGEFLRLQVASLRCSLCNSVLTTMCYFRGQPSP